jgi:hypothetical protein
VGSPAAAEATVETYLLNSNFGNPAVKVEKRAAVPEMAKPEPGIESGQRYSLQEPN